MDGYEIWALFVCFGGICIVVSWLRERDDSFDEHFPMRIDDEAVPISNGVWKISLSF